MAKNAAQIAPVATGTADAQGLAAQGNRVLLGYAIHESAGTPAAAAATLRHGTAATDPEIATEELAANGSAKAWFGPNGIAVPNGVFVDRISGETKLSLFWSTD